jgi:hypothetical protein
MTDTGESRKTHPLRRETDIVWVPWRMTAAPYQYESCLLEAAKQGGMPAVCETEFFKERIASNPANYDRLLGMDPQCFIDVMARWREYFIRDTDLPVIGTSAEALGSIKVPTCVIPGNDWTHPRRVRENASRLLPNSELHILLPQDVEVDVSTAGWDEKRQELAAIFIDFLNRVSVASPA